MEAKLMALVEYRHCERGDCLISVYLRQLLRGPEFVLESVYEDLRVTDVVTRYDLCHVWTAHSTCECPVHAALHTLRALCLTFNIGGRHCERCTALENLK